MCLIYKLIYTFYDTTTTTTYTSKIIDNPIHPTPPLGQNMTQGQFLSGV